LWIAGDIVQFFVYDLVGYNDFFQVVTRNCESQKRKVQNRPAKCAQKPGVTPVPHMTPMSWIPFYGRPDHARVIAI